ncbi:MAG: hypothetical protein V5A24_08210 [Haloarculaceae archaeon]
MVPDYTRRRLLQATGVTLASGLAGCEVRHEPATETTRQTTPLEADRTTPSYGDVGPNADDGNESSDGGDARTDTPTKTVTAGRTFSVEVESSITAEDLRKADLDPDTPTTITIIVEKNWSDGTEERPFDEQVELAPGATRSVPDAFTTKRHGPSYIVRAKLESVPGEENARSSNLSDARRFTPGGFNEPEGTTFRIWVGDFEDDDRIRPYVGLDVPTEDDRS